jgi:PAS domain S-box-containing protein
MQFYYTSRAVADDGIRTMPPDAGGPVRLPAVQPAWSMPVPSPAPFSAFPTTRSALRCACASTSIPAAGFHVGIFKPQHKTILSGHGIRLARWRRAKVPSGTIFQKLLPLSASSGRRKQGLTRFKKRHSQEPEVISQLLEFQSANIPDASIRCAASAGHPSATGKIRTAAALAGHRRRCPFISLFIKPNIVPAPCRAYYRQLSDYMCATMTKPYAISSLAPDHLAELTRLMIEEVKEAAVFFMDVNGIIESWNSAAEEMKGFTAEDAIGSHLSLLYTDEDKALHWAEHNIDEAKKNGFFREERWRQRKDGSLFWARVLLTALRNDSGEHVGFSKITLDLTEHKLLERCVKEKEETQRVLSAANAGTWTWHPDTGQMDICRHFIALLGHTGDDTTIPFAQWLAFLHPDHRTLAKDAFESSHASCPGKPVHLELMMRQKNGTYRWYAVRAYWYQEKPGAPYMLQGVNIDIQELKTIGEEHQQAIEQLKAEDVRKNEFLAMLAHELRNPLAPISAGAELLKIVRRDEERVRQTSEIISRQISHMTNLVNDLLDVSRVTRGLAELDNVFLDMRHVVAHAVEQANPLLQSKLHHLALHMPPDTAMVAGDEKRLVQVVANLLNNAAKYTPEGGNIILKIEVHAFHVMLEIADDGIGMAPELVNRVFDLFAQAERTPDRSSGGLGLGLALVKSLVELHGGSVAAASEGIGKGSRFTVVLPRMHEQVMDAAAADDRQRLQNASRSLKILVVDDNEDAAAMLGMLLEASGHHVLAENDARQALARAGLESPDVCLLDIGLPGMDGHELAQRLRAQPATANAVLIAVTGYGQENDQRKALAAGFDHHLTKPVDIGKLTSILDGISPSDQVPGIAT